MGRIIRPFQTGRIDSGAFLENHGILAKKPWIQPLRIPAFQRRHRRPRRRMKPLAPASLADSGGFHVRALTPPFPSQGGGCSA